MSGFFKPADYLSEDPATVSERKAKRLWYDARQRAKLCRAMVRVTARRGYADTSVHEALRIAGYGKAAYYRHFDDRGSCLLEACREAQQRWLGGLTHLLHKCLSADAPEADGELARLVAGGVFERLMSSLREEPERHLAEALPDLVFVVLAPYVGVEAAMWEMGLRRRQLAGRPAPKPRVSVDLERSEAGERSPKEELLAELETMSNEEATRARLVIEDDCP